MPHLTQLGFSFVARPKLIQPLHKQELYLILTGPFTKTGILLQNSSPLDWAFLHVDRFPSGPGILGTRGQLRFLHLSIHVDGWRVSNHFTRLRCLFAWTDSSSCHTLWRSLLDWSFLQHLQVKVVAQNLAWPFQIGPVYSYLDEP